MDSIFHRIGHALRRRRTQSQRQDGYVLVVALLVTFAISVLVVAMLGLTLATTVYSKEQGRRDREARAADAAMESTLNEIARDRTGNLGLPIAINSLGAVVPATSCTVPPSGPVGEVRDSNNKVITPGINIFVKCTPMKSPTGALAGVGGNDWVKVLGDDYRGQALSPWRTNAAFPWAGVLGGYWTAASQAELAATKASVVASGPEPLSFAANLRVKSGVAATRNPVVTDPVSDDAALSVSGQFFQGDDGLFAASNTADPTSPFYDPADPSNSCGILQRTAHVWGGAADPAAELSLHSGALRSPGGMACDDARSKLMSTVDPSLVPAGPTVWTKATIKATRRTAPSGCPGGATITLTAGAYAAAEVEKLNTLFSGSCGGKAIIFEHGDYWFDANSSGASGNAIIFNDPSQRIVFGTPRSSGAPATDFPQACDPAQPGVAITLSGRTVFQHQRGLVAICGENGPASVAIFQTGNANLGVPAAPGAASGGDFSNPSAALATDGSTTNASFPCVTPLLQDCSGPKTLTLENLAGLTGNPGSAPLSALWVYIRAAEHSANSAGSGVKLRVETTDTNPVTCEARFDGLPQEFDTIAYDLFDPARSSCPGVLTDRAQLYGARLVVTFEIRSDCGLIGVICWSTGPTIEVDSVTVRMPWMPEASGATAPASTAGGYVDPAGALTANDGLVAKKKFPITFWCFITFTCPGSQSARLTLTNLQDVNDPELSAAAPSTLQLTSAHVMIAGDSDHANGSAANTRLTFSRGGSIVCFVQVINLPERNQTMTVNLLDTTQLGDCATKLTKASQLVGTDLEVKTFLDRNYPLGLPIDDEWGATIDSVQVAVTSAIPAGAPGGGEAADPILGSYSGPGQPFIVTSDNATATRATWSVMGSVSMPKAALDVYWKGSLQYGSSSDPIPGAIAVPSLFSGSGFHALTFGSIGSFAPAGAEVGVLCCKPAKPVSRRVQLEARLGSATGPLRGTAQVLIGDESVDPLHPGVWNAGQRVTVEDWAMCNKTAAATSCDTGTAPPTSAP